jgi:limonene-1,2-epoxide hydrolase
MALSHEVDITSDSNPVARSCETVRRYVSDALFGGDERALRETVADSDLMERAWLFWAAFTDRALDDIDVLFASADGSRVACHLTGTMVQEGQWITSASAAGGRLVKIECTGVYMVDDDKIINFRETWR